MQVEVIELWPTEENCTICCKIVPLGFSLPMYEGKVVDTTKTDDWAGAYVCKSCHDAYYQDMKGNPYSETYNEDAYSEKEVRIIKAREDKHQLKFDSMKL